MHESRRDDVEKRSIAFQSLEQEVYLSLVLSTARLSHDVDCLMKRSGLTQPQYNVLRILRGAGPEGLGRNQIRERLVTTMPDVTRLLDRMEAIALIARKRNESDRRQRTTTLTAAGSKLVRSIDGPLRKLHRRHAAGAQNQDLRAMLRVLAQLRANADAV